MPEPDARCKTTPDGDCVSEDCMHTDAPATAEQERARAVAEGIFCSQRTGPPTLKENLDRSTAAISNALAEQRERDAQFVRDTDGEQMYERDLSLDDFLKEIAAKIERGDA